MSTTLLDELVGYVINKCEIIRGKKAFQKIFYFLTEEEVPTGLTYSLYQYGPYCADLDGKMEQMQLDGVISVSQIGRGYRIARGNNVDCILRDNSLGEHVERINSILDKLPLDNPLRLELLSTTHYAAKVQKEIYDITDTDLVVCEVKKIKKEKFSEEQIRDAYKFLDELQFI